MTVANALTFIKRGLSEKTLRSRMNAADSVQAIEDILTEEKIHFTADEFDEAFYQRLRQCQEVDEADQMKEFKLWWNLLIQTMAPAACTGGCSGCSG
ncbi:conserved hypothetical protein [Desulfosarcina cetonica]|uniref:Nif11-like leader peptide family natural product precursor n=1 Tax=Desulfosarcina cetonica TaxID=90730 RepID=UPI0006CFAF72|nr:Nif11-like leader peptide family natural product precursor [Desulfosarcina cetonica]VTR64370.1 conserved hypothetical protein [Desulfosarcina cetonica]